MSSLERQSCYGKSHVLFKEVTHRLRHPHDDDIATEVIVEKKESNIKAAKSDVKAKKIIKKFAQEGKKPSSKNWIIMIWRNWLIEHALYIL